MPDPGSNSAAKAIEEAFQDQVKELFKGLFNNLVVQPSSHQTNEQSLAKFAAGLDVANRARQLALSAAPAAVPAVAAAVRRSSKKSKGKKLAPG